MWTVRVGAVGATNVHTVPIKVHLAALLGDRLWCRDGRREGGARRGIVVGGVEGGRYGVRVVHVGEGGRLAHEGGPNGRETKVLLEWASGAYYRVFVELECVNSEGHLRLRGVEVRRLHRLVERVLIQSGLCVGVVRYHDAIDGGYLRGGFCPSLGRLIRR